MTTLPDSPASPVVLHVPTGHSCNNRCVFCIERSRGAQSRFGMAEIEDQLDRMLPRTKEVIFTAGEPTLNPLLAPSAAAARERGYEVIGVVTNGRRLRDEKLCTDLLEAGINDIRVALVGPRAEVHDSITRRKGSFVQTVKGLQNLAALRRRFSFHFEVNCTLIRSNLRLLREINDFAHGFGIDRINFNVVEPCGSSEDNFDLVMPRYTEVMEVVDRCGLDFRSPTRALSRVPACAGGLEWVQETFLFSRGEKVGQYDPLAGKVKGPPCADCAIDDRCPGIWQRYVQEYGWEEFTPVVHPSRRRGQILRVLTGSPCNNRCMHCIEGPAAAATPRAMPVSRQLRDGILAGFRKVEFAGGEFLLDQRFHDLVCEANDRGYEAVAIETNARVLCVPRFMNMLVGLRPSEVIVRLNAGDAGVHDAMARVPGAFDQTMRGMRLLAEHAIPFSVRLRRHPRNSASVEEARELAKQAGARGFEVIKS